VNGRWAGAPSFCQVQQGAGGDILLQLARGPRPAYPGERPGFDEFRRHVFGFRSEVDVPMGAVDPAEATGGWFRRRVVGERGRGDVRRIGARRPGPPSKHDGGSAPRCRPSREGTSGHGDLGPSVDHHAERRRPLVGDEEHGRSVRKLGGAGRFGVEPHTPHDRCPTSDSIARPFVTSAHSPCPGSGCTPAPPPQFRRAAGNGAVRSAGKRAVPGEHTEHVSPSGSSKQPSRRTGIWGMASGARDRAEVDQPRQTSFGPNRLLPRSRCTPVLPPLGFGYLLQATVSRPGGPVVPGRMIR